MRVVFNILIYLSIAIILGSILFFGVIVAPLVFKSGMLPNKSIAGSLNVAILYRMCYLHIICSIVLFSSFLFKVISYKKKSFWLATILSVVVLGISIYNFTELLPRMDKIRIAIGNFDEIPKEKLLLKTEFDFGHKKYSTLVKTILGLSFILLVMNNTASDEKNEIKKFKSNKKLIPDLKTAKFEIVRNPISNDIIPEKQNEVPNISTSINLEQTDKNQNPIN
jgi:hypothetical protein